MRKNRVFVVFIVVLLAVVALGGCPKPTPVETAAKASSSPDLHWQSFSPPMGYGGVYRAPLPEGGGYVWIVAAPSGNVAIMLVPDGSVPKQTAIEP